MGAANIAEGFTFSATHERYPGYEDFYIIDKIVDDSEIVLKCTRRVKPNQQDENFTENHPITIVERQWFDTKLTVRKIRCRN